MPAERLSYAIVDTPLGAMAVVASEKGIRRLSFDEDVAALGERYPGATLEPDDGRMAAWVEIARAAIEDPCAVGEVPLDLRGTAFQRQVWTMLLAIPAGETRTYQDLAHALGKPGAERAVGSANGANPVSVLVPCHRVIRADGGLGGYAYGLERKRWLLEKEGALAQAGLDL